MSPNKQLKVAGKPSPGRRRYGLAGRRRFHPRGRSSGFTAPSRDDQQFNEEAHKIEKLILEMSAGLERAERKVKSHVAEIDRTLAELALQKDQIRILERGLGIER
ncbi:MAG: hypothetical protein QOF89_4292 [Acidobacteriota bacterium]|nr:hypothetical protein [Acidobacteriota bacterium]